MIGCEWVVRFLCFATYPASNGCFSYLFRSSFVVAFVVRSVRFWVLFVPECLAVGASGGVACQPATVQAGSLNHLCLRCCWLIIFGVVLFHLMWWCRRLLFVPIVLTVTDEGCMMTV